MAQDFYHVYLQSDAWKALQARILGRCNGVCEKCGQRPAKDLHHLSYIRLGHERPEDVVYLCGFCHLLAHGQRQDYELLKQQPYGIEAMPTFNAAAASS